jgi:hypothetical protein
MKQRGRNVEKHLLGPGVPPNCLREVRYEHEDLQALQMSLEPLIKNTEKRIRASGQPSSLAGRKSKLAIIDRASDARV